MAGKSSKGPNKPSAYGSAADLPSYRELAQQIRGFKLLTLFFARRQRREILEIERQMKRLTRVVDDFYERLGPRNWIFHDMLSVDRIEQLLAETPDAESAEECLIQMYRDPETMKWWMMRLRSYQGLRERLHQIERAFAHYNAGQWDSCVLHLIAVMDGFVNDFEPGERQGLHSRQPDEMAAWDSVVGHHMGLTHAMATFNKTIKKRVDDEVFELQRHGIMHGTIVRFDNVVVATKAWNMLFAVADWATATTKAADPKKPEPSWGETWSTVKRRAAYKKYQRGFTATTVEASDPSFATDEVVARASEFLDAWERGRWGIVAKFTPPMLRAPGSDGQTAREAKDTFEAHGLTDWTITSLTYDQASTAEIKAQARVNDELMDVRFRMVFWSLDGNVGIPHRDEGNWSLAVWAPRTFLQPRV
jgi:ASC-1-like (ASCH) protein